MYNKYEYKNTSYRSKEIKKEALKGRLVIELGILYVVLVTLYLIV